MLKEGRAQSFRHYSVSDGLPSSEVYQVIQDPENYLWFATDRGICKYDGREFEVFTQSDGLPDDVVFGFHLDYFHRLWFYTYTGGVAYYEEGQIKEPSFNAMLKKLLHEDSYPIISSLAIDREKNVWIGTYSDVLYHFDQSKKTLTRLNSFQAGEYVTLYDVEPQDTENYIYAGRKMRSNVLPKISVLDSDGEVLFYQDLPQSKNPKAYYPKLIPLDTTTFAYTYGNELLKIGRNGVIESTHTSSWILYCQPDEEGNLWVGTRSGALYYEQADLNRSPIIFLQDYDVSSCLQDREGGLWFTTLNNGILYTPNLEVQSVPKAQIGNSRLSRIIGNDYGVYVANSKGKVYFFPDGNLDQPFLVSSLLQKTGRLSYTKDRKVIYYSLKSNQHILDGDRIKEVQNEHKFFKNDNRSPFFWRYNGLEKNMLIYDSETDVERTFSPQLKISVLAVLPANQQVWCGGFKGLYRIEGEEAIWMGEQFPVLAGRVADLDVIDDQHILISTRGKGAWIMNGITNTLSKIENIPNAHCHTSLVDHSGNLWLATFTGVYKVTSPLDNPSVSRYSYREGLLSNEAIGLIEYNDQIWVATNEGISVFDVDWVPNNLKDAPLEIQGIQINHRDTSILDAYQLSHYQNNIVVSCNVISTTMPIAYEYKMSGLQEDWIMMEDHNIIFSGLRPGGYILHLRTNNSSASTNTRQIAFNIAQPFWMAYWFQGAVLGGLFLIIGVIGRVRYQVIRRENKLYKLFVRSEQKALRSQMNPHFLFNALNLLLDLLMSKKQENVINYVHDLSLLMRNILEHSRKEYISLREEITFLQLYLKLGSQRFGKELEYSIEVGPEVSVNNFMIPPLLIQSYVENAFKHGVASRNDGKAKIWIKFYVNEGKLMTEVGDNGIGYDDQRPKRSRKYTSLGMRINGERLQLLGSDNAYGFQIQTLDPAPGNRFKGTLIHLTFPLNPSL